MMRRTVRTYQQSLSTAEFCQRLGIPESEAPHLHMVYANVFLGPTVAFVHNTSPYESEQWNYTFLSARQFYKRLGVPREWRSHGISYGPRGDTIEMRFCQV